MTKNEAIKNFEKRNFWLKANPVCQNIKERVDKQNAEIERNMLAVSALREQAEREKGDTERCIYKDTENGWCKLHSDWTEPMPVIEYCTDEPCPDKITEREKRLIVKEEN